MSTDDFGSFQGRRKCSKFRKIFHYDVKLRLLAHSWSFLANQKVRNAIVGAENLLKKIIHLVKKIFSWLKKFGAS